MLGLGFGVWGCHSVIAAAQNCVCETGCCQQRLVLVVAASSAFRRDLRSAVFPAGVIVTALVTALVTAVVFMPKDSHETGFVSIKYF